MSEKKKTPTFRDAEGRDWSVAFNLGIVRDLKDTVGFDFGDLQDGRGLIAISTDMEKFGAILWMICEKQAIALKVSEEDFAKGIDADAMEQASDAIIQAVLNFTQPRIRPAVEEVFARIETAQAAGVEEMQDWAKDGKIEEEVRKEMREKLETFGK